MPKGTHPRRDEPLEVGVRALRAELGRWLEIARERDVVITDRGHPVARLVPIGEHPGLERLLAEGSVTPPSTTAKPARGAARVRARLPVSDLVAQQRR